MLARLLTLIGLLFTLGCQANPPYPVEIVRYDASLACAWRVESGGIIPSGTELTIGRTAVAQARGKLNPPLARAGITGAEPPATEAAYHVTASGGVVPAEFDAYLVTLNGRELLGLPLLNGQREQVGPAGFVGEALTLQQLALLERDGDVLRVRFPRRLLAWMPWLNFPTNVHEGEETYRPPGRRESVTISFSDLLDLYRTHMDEPDFWGEPVTLRRADRPADAR